MSEKVIITFKDNVTQEQITQFTNRVNSQGGKVTENLSNINGLAAQLPTSFAQSLQGDDIIEAIEPDGVATIQK